MQTQHQPAPLWEPAKQQPATVDYGPPIIDSAPDVEPPVHTGRGTLNGRGWDEVEADPPPSWSLLQYADPLQEKIDELEGKIGELNATIEQKTRDLKQVSEHYVSLLLLWQAQQQDIGQLGAANQELSVELTALQQAIESKESEIAELNSQNQELQGHIETLGHNLVTRIEEARQLQAQSQAQLATIEQLEARQAEQRRLAAAQAEQAHVRPARARLRRLERQTHEGVILHRRERMDLKKDGATEPVVASSALTSEEHKQLAATPRAQEAGEPVAAIELEQAARRALKMMANERDRADAVEKLKTLYLNAQSPVQQAHIAGTLLKREHVELLSELLKSTDPRNLLGVRLKEETRNQIVAIAEEQNAVTQAQGLVELATGGDDGGGDKGGSKWPWIADDPDPDRRRLIQALLGQDEETLIEAISSNSDKVREAVKKAVQWEPVLVRDSLKTLLQDPEAAQFAAEELKRLGAAHSPAAPPAAVAKPSAAFSMPRDYAELAKQLLEPEFVTALGTSCVGDTDAGPVLLGYYVKKLAA